MRVDFPDISLVFFVRDQPSLDSRNLELGGMLVLNIFFLVSKSRAISPMST